MDSRHVCYSEHMIIRHDNTFEPNLTGIDKKQVHQHKCKQRKHLVLLSTACVKLSSLKHIRRWISHVKQTNLFCEVCIS